jgi:hypothetical protein
MGRREVLRLGSRASSRGRYGPGDGPPDSVNDARKAPALDPTRQCEPLLRHDISVLLVSSVALLLQDNGPADVAVHL